MNQLTTNQRELTILKEEMLSMFPKYIYSAKITKTNELVLGIYRKKIKSLIKILKNHVDFQYDILSDMTGVDYPQENQRFLIVYNLLGAKFASRIRLIVQTNELSPIESITEIHPSANWFEREIWDMFGIYFTNHPDLRRILTDYGFEGHPLRKDFPLSGFVEVRYDEEEKRVITEPVELTQEFRSFDFLSPWEPWEKSQFNQIINNQENTNERESNDLHLDLKRRLDQVIE